MGCHATAADAEEWERDEGFLIEDGIQCETCHGTGSEYMDEEVMRDRELAMKRGLRFPTATNCMTCHNPKGSHEAVLPSKPYVVEEALRQIAARLGGGPTVIVLRHNGGRHQHHYHCRPEHPSCRYLAHPVHIVVSPLAVRLILREAVPRSGVPHGTDHRPAPPRPLPLR